MKMLTSGKSDVYQKADQLCSVSKFIAKTGHGCCPLQLNLIRPASGNKESESLRGSFL